MFNKSHDFKEIEEQEKPQDQNPKSKFLKRLLLGVILIAVVIVGYFYWYIPNQQSNQAQGQTYQVDGVVYALVFEPSHFVGVAGKGGHSVPDKWFIHIAFYNSITGEDKLLKWEVSQGEFNSHKVGEQIKVNVN